MQRHSNWCWSVNISYTTAVVLLLLFNWNFIPVTSFVFPIAPRNELPGTPRPLGSIWPRPHLHYQETPAFPVDVSKFEIHLRDAFSNERVNCSVLDWALDHYTRRIRSLSPDGNESGISQDLTVPSSPWVLVVNLEECRRNFPENYTTAYETYRIESRQQHLEGNKRDGLMAEIRACSPQAVLRALESLYQMLWPKVLEDGRKFLYHLNATLVKDFPRFIHRGFMLDTARHFVSEKVILQILTGLMYNKLNVFHWHIVDDQSFPFQSETFPELSEKGAYHRNAVYPPDAVQRIIEAARVRGIRTILEFDTPGHVEAIGKSHPELLTPCYGDGIHPGTPDRARFAGSENLDPSNEKVYPFMRGLFTEIVQNVSRDPYIHLGMDEVYPACWESSPEIRKFMERNNYTRIAQVQQHYTTRHVAMVKNLGAKMIAWQDPIDDGVVLDKEVVIHIWKDWTYKTAMKSILKKEYKVLLSACWYMNYISYGTSWFKYYECDPYLNGTIPHELRKQVLGGEAAMWGEFVDATNIVSRIFPYIGAVAVVLWDSNIDTPIGRENVNDALFRLDSFRCTLLQRGIPAQPIYPGTCGGFETEVDFN